MSGLRFDHHGPREQPMTQVMAHRWMWVAMAVTLAVVGVGVPSDASAEPADHVPLELAGETVVHATGPAALRLQVPVTARFGDYENLSIELHDGSAAFVGYDVLGRCLLDSNADEGMCMTTSFWQFPPGVFPAWPHLINAGNPLSVGPVNMFIVTDGSVTVTMRVPELDGRVEVDAVGDLDAVLERLPVTCPTGDCHHVGWGGVTHEVGPGPGFGGVVAQARIPDGTPIPNQDNAFGVTLATPCAYPSRYAPGASADPDDHPTGCDLGVTDEDKRNHTLGTAQRIAFRTTYQAWRAGYRSPGGPVYLGFIGGQFSPFEATHGAGWYRADAVWLTQAYDCPASGCFAHR